MGWRGFVFGRSLFRNPRAGLQRLPDAPKLHVERLEPRTLLAVSASLAGGDLVLTGGADRDIINLYVDSASAELVARDAGNEVGRFSAAAVSQILVSTGAGDDVVRIAGNVFQPVTLDGGPGNDFLFAGGGPATISGGDGKDILVGGPAADVLLGDGGSDKLFGLGGDDVLDGGPGRDKLFGVASTDRVIADGADKVFQELPDALAALAWLPPSTLALTDDEVSQLLQRAAAASASEDAIIAIVDRGGRILGVRVEGGVSPTITGDVASLTFAIDGALAKARTAAFFANNAAPLTSRTIQFISQSTITQREVESNPSITDPNSTLRGPGFVAPVGLGGHFPAGIPFTPQVDLFAIEHTNRDSIVHPGPDRIKGTADDAPLPNRFNVAEEFIPGSIPLEQRLTPPESYGFASGRMPEAQSRGIGTLPGGIPLFKQGIVVGGIGVFFPGATGFATEENSSLSTTFNPAKPDRSLEAEYIAFAAAGGSSGAGAPIGALAGVGALPGFDLPFGRIDLVGITVDIYGPQGRRGVPTLLALGRVLGVGDANSGANQPVHPGPDGLPGTADDGFLLDGAPAPDGWLVTPHDGVGLTAADVILMINQGIAEAQRTRAAIRLPLDSRTRMVFAVTDITGEVLGLYRMPDATVFSLDVAVAKARNVGYYADAGSLQAVDQIAGVPAGVAFSNRTFRFVAQPRFPEGIDGAPPGPHSILNEDGVDPPTGRNAGPPLPASAFQSVMGFDAFNPGTNFRDPNNILNQNGIVFFPGSSPLYKDVNGDGVKELVGGLGVSGDGVDQDDVVTTSADNGFEPGSTVLRADQVFVQGVRLPYQKFNRNPSG